MCCGVHVLQVFVREVAAFLVCVRARLSAPVTAYFLSVEHRVSNRHFASGQGPW